MKISPPYKTFSRLWLLLLISLLFACRSPKNMVSTAYKKMSAVEKQTADSLLAYGLDHEALYTLLDTLKPVSSIKLYRLPLLSSLPHQRDSALSVLQNVQKVAIGLSRGDFEFLVTPFERRDSVYKNIELYVVRKSRLKSMIRSHRDFYARLGITEDTPPATVLAITEYENKYDRWRSYGYLFGYPDYAVDFFVEAGKTQDSTSQFVKRDFFQIPVYASEKGYFTYAIPQGHTPGATDSLIHQQAGGVLQGYKIARPKYRYDSGLKATKLWYRKLKK